MIEVNDFLGDDHDDDDDVNDNNYSDHHSKLRSES